VYSGPHMQEVAEPCLCIAVLSQPLRLVCTRRKPVREMLDIWLTLPIVRDDQELGHYCRPHMENVENIIAAPEHRDRVCQITLENMSPSLFPVLAEMMQESFPALTHLLLDSENTSLMLHPESFLGGSAPRLQSLVLRHIPFPALPTPLLTTKDLVELRLWTIPYSGYLSPDAMVVCLSSFYQARKSYPCIQVPTILPYQFDLICIDMRHPSLSYPISVLWRQRLH
jgi:hypothetical protein